VDEGQKPRGKGGKPAKSYRPPKAERDAARKASGAPAKPRKFSSGGPKSPKSR
jgi:hypothetical protein